MTAPCPLRPPVLRLSIYPASGTSCAPHGLDGPRGITRCHYLQDTEDDDPKCRIFDLPCELDAKGRPQRLLKCKLSTVNDQP